MKNIILGAAGTLIVLLTIASCLSIYSISTRKNEMENCVARVLSQDLRLYYGSGKTDSEVQELVKKDLTAQMTSSSMRTVEVRACDMTSGILSVRVTESFKLPGGMTKTIACEKTIIVETEEEYETEGTEEDAT